MESKPKSEVMDESKLSSDITAAGSTTSIDGHKEDSEPAQVEAGTKKNDGNDSYSRGALRAYLTLAGAAFALFNTVGFLNAFGVFQAYYFTVGLKGYSEFAISWIGSVSTFILFLSTTPAGILADRYGPALPISLGSLIEVFGIFMLSLCKTGQYYQFFLAQAVLMPLGMGLLTIPPMAVIATTFKKNRALGLGITVGGSSIGGLIWPVVLNQLLNVQGISFGWTIRACGLIMFVTLVFACLTIPLSTHKKTKKATEVAGAVNSGEADAVEKTEVAAQENAKPQPKTRLQIIRSTPVLLMFGSLSICYLGLFTPFFYVSTYALARGVDTVLAFYMVSVLNGVSLFGRVLAGAAADRFGCFNMFSLAAVASAIIIYCWTAATSAAGIIVFAAFYGFTSGAIFSLTSACAVQLATPETVGTLMGVLMSASSITGLVGTPISGQLVLRGYLALSMYAASAMLVGALFVISARLYQNKGLWVKV